MKVTKKKLNLVTGACGFSGSHLVKQLLDAGERVIATDLERAFRHPKNTFIFERIGLDFDHPNCEVIPSDLLRPSSLAPLFERKPTHVYHTASLYDYSASMEILERVNVQGSINLFELACEAEGLERFIHWSTCGVFGKPYTAAEGLKNNIPFSELSSSPKNTPYGQPQPDGTNLVNDYSVTKWKQEQIAWRYHRERGMPLTVIRPAPLYGPGSDYGHGGILLALHGGWVPFIPRDARNYISTSVHVDDIAGFARFAADHAETEGEDYNVVDDSIISYYEFVRYLALILGRRLWDIPFLNLRRAQPHMERAARAWRYLHERWGVPRIRVFEVGSATYISSSYWLSNGKSKRAGYVYQYPNVRLGMRETLEWFRDAGWLEPGYTPEAIWQDTMEASAPPPAAPRKRRPLRGVAARAKSLISSR